MPRYDFECPVCQTVDEFIAPSCEAIMACPQCGGAMKGLIPRASFHNAISLIAFKGRGRNGQWLEKPETQAQLKSGELYVASKSDDIMHE